MLVARINVLLLESRYQQSASEKGCGVLITQS